jgi:hypothetical protein
MRPDENLAEERAANPAYDEALRAFEEKHLAIPPHVGEHTEAPSSDTRRTLNPEKYKADVRFIRPNYRQVMRLQLLGLGVAEIAMRTGMSPRNLSHITNSDLYKAEFEKLQQGADEEAIAKTIDVSEKIKDMCGISVVQLDEMLHDRRELSKKRADVCFGILRLGGHDPRNSVDLPGENYADALTRAYARRKAAALENTPINVIQINGQTVNLALTPQNSAPIGGIELLEPEHSSNGNGNGNGVEPPSSE